MFDWVQKRLVSSANIIGSSTEDALAYNNISSGPKITTQY